MDTELERRVMAAIADQVGCPLSRLSPQTDLSRDLGVDGDDAVDLLLRLSEEFGINMDNLRFDRHFGPEGSNLFALFLPSFWRWRRERLPMTIADLIEAARAQSWPIQYSRGPSA